MSNSTNFIEEEHPFNEQNVCVVVDLWHDYYHQNKDLPRKEYGTTIPCLVRRWKIDKDKAELEVVLDDYYVKEKSFNNTPLKRVYSWCYVDNLLPKQDQEERYIIKKSGDFFYVEIDIKDNFDEFFSKLDAKCEAYNKLYDEFRDYEEGLFFIGEAHVPIEDTRYWGFHNQIHLYVLRFNNNGQTLLASRNRLMLEMAVGMANNTRLVKIN